MKALLCFIFIFSSSAYSSRDLEQYNKQVKSVNEYLVTLMKSFTVLPDDTKKERKLELQKKELNTYLNNFDQSKLYTRISYNKVHNVILNRVKSINELQSQNKLIGDENVFSRFNIILATIGFYNENSLHKDKLEVLLNNYFKKSMQRKQNTFMETLLLGSELSEWYVVRGLKKEKRELLKNFRIELERQSGLFSKQMSKQLTLKKIKLHIKKEREAADLAFQKLKLIYNIKE
jgi:hypothetical protein